MSGLGSHVCIPSGIAEIKTQMKKKKLAEKHTDTQGPAWHASGGLRWINLQVAGWVSTAGAAAPPARNWNGNPAAEPHIGERFPCQEIGKNLHVNEKFFFLREN